MSKPRTHHGLVVPIHARLRGRLRWRVLDERGVPEVPRNPSGFALGPVEGVEQHNLITNAGLDRVATLDINQPEYRNVLAVGTGSVAPAFTDVQLDAEVQRGTNPLGVTDIVTHETDTVGKVWRFSRAITRGLTMTADRNLTEFGLTSFTTVGGGPLNIRELFRDGVGTPVTISLLNGKTIRIDHTLHCEFPRPDNWVTGTVTVEEYDAVNALISTDTVNVYYVPASAGGSAAIWLKDMWNPTLSSSLTGASGIHTRLATPDLDSNHFPGLVISPRRELSITSYTAGTYQRLKRATLLESDSNGTWVGFMCSFSGADGRNATVAVNFEAPFEFVKDDTKTARVGFYSTWARA